MMISPLIITKDFNRPYFSRGKSHFLIYQLDGSVRGRKSGFYIPPIIFFDKLEFFIQIGRKNYPLHDYIKKTKINSIKTVHYFNLDKKKIKLTYFLPDELNRLIISINCNKKIKIIARFNFPFNYVWHENPYKKFKYIENKKEIQVISEFDENLKCIIKSNKKLELTKNGIAINAKDIELKIQESFDNYQVKNKTKYYETGTIFKCNDKDLTESFNFAKYNIKLLRHYQSGLGEGYLAGIPDYPEYFGRDTFWSIPGILMSGDFAGVRDSINTFIRHQSLVKTETKDIGEIPHEIWLTGEPDYYSADSTLLFIHTLYNYYKWTRDINYIKNMFESVKLAAEWGIKKTKNDFIVHGKEGFLKDTTWMDSYFRGSVAIDMQALYIESLKCASFLADKLNEKNLAKKWNKFSEKTKSKLNKLWMKDRFVDHINTNGTFSKSITINPFVVFLFGLADKNKAEKFFHSAKETGLWNNQGIRTRAKTSRGYNSKSYHKGSIWPFTNGWAALAFFRYNKNEDAFNVLKNFPVWYQKFVPGFMPEYLDGERANYIGGCYMQLWSSSLYIQSIIEGLCGIEPIPPNKVRIKPNLPKQINSIEIKDLRIFDSKLNVSIKRGQNKIKVNYKIFGDKIKCLN